MIKTINAQFELDFLKRKVKGIFYCKYTKAYKLVIQYNENSYDAIQITEFGVIQKEYGFPRENGHLEIFPDNKNMLEMLQDVFDWDVFMKKFNK